MKALSYPVSPHSDIPMPLKKILDNDYYNYGEEYRCYRSQGRADWLILYTLSGKGIVEDGKGKIVSQSGDVVVIPPGMMQYYYTAPGHHWEKMWCHYIPRNNWIEWFTVSFPANKIIHLHIPDPYVHTYIQTAFHQLIQFSHQYRHLFLEQLSFNALEQLLLLIANFTAEKNIRLDQRIMDILQYLSLNYSKEISIEKLAKMVYLSPSRLAHLFKEQVGESIVETLNSIRIKQAAKLLKFTNKTVDQTAKEVGFNSSDYFSRKFTKAYGVSPSAYRSEPRMSK